LGGQIRWNDVHLDPNGHFDQHRLATIEAETERNAFGVSRAIHNMEWVMEYRPSVEDIVEY